MLSDKMTKELNNQIQFELYSGHLYVSLAAHCASLDLDGFSNFFIVQEQEERFHAMKIFNYIKDQGNDIKIYGLDDPKKEFKDLEEVITFAWHHEQSVTKRFNDLMEIAVKEKDFATQNFLQWFINEQVEEEATLLTLLKKIKLVAGQGHGILMLDNELAARQFTPPVAE
ncbi:ferritin [Calditrichota bacterium]